MARSHEHWSQGSSGLSVSYVASDIRSSCRWQSLAGVGEHVLSLFQSRSVVYGDPLLVAVLGLGTLSASIYRLKIMGVAFRPIQYNPGGVTERHEKFWSDL